MTILSLPSTIGLFIMDSCGCKNSLFICNFTGCIVRAPHVVLKYSVLRLEFDCGLSPFISSPDSFM